MSLREFQRALTAMTLDVRFCATVYERGEDALRDYALSAREARRLAAVARQPGMALNCTLARANRFGAVHDAFPMTCALLGERLREVLDGLWSSSVPDNVQLSGDVEPFAALVEEHIAAGDGGANPYLAEILAYERASLELAQLVRHAADPEALPPTSRWVAFEHDPQALFGPLERVEAPPPDLARGAYRVRITLDRGELEITTFEAAKRGV